MKEPEDSHKIVGTFRRLFIFYFAIVGNEGSPQKFTRNPIFF